MPVSNRGAFQLGKVSSAAMLGSVTGMLVAVASLGADPGVCLGRAARDSAYEGGVTSKPRRSFAPRVAFTLPRTRQRHFQWDSN